MSQVKVGKIHEAQIKIVRKIELDRVARRINASRRSKTKIVIGDKGNLLAADGIRKTGQRCGGGNLSLSNKKHSRQDSGRRETP
jgi:hypothetical protein